MKICFVSDLHCDVGSQPSIQWPEADVLVIAGDTANSIGEVDKFLRKLVKKNIFEHIFFVDGNHEHYSNGPQGRSLGETLNRIEALAPANTTCLSLTDAVSHGGLYFVGRNGWYSMDASGDPMSNRTRWRERMNDNRWIGFDKIIDGEVQPQPWELAELHAREIEDMIDKVVEQDSVARFVVVTHTAPTRATLSTRTEHLLDNAFYANLYMEKVIAKHCERIAVWAHGHTHYRQDKVVDGVYVIVNPRGYPGENSSWEPIVLDI
jgi:Icc-related predicted phosphoesterase